MKLSVYSGIVELFRSLRYNDFAIQNVAQKYPEYVYDLVFCGLRRFRYMTVSVQRGGQFRYMTTSVHMRSISVHVFFVVRLRYMRSTISVHHYVDIGRGLHCKRASFYAEGLSANAEWMFSLLC